MRWHVILIFAGALGAGGLAARAEAPAPAYGLPYLARFDRLPVLKPGFCKQVSSFDRSGGNGDAGHFLNGDAGKLPDDTAVLADLKGPGCVYRIWSANAAGRIRFFFDGEAEPRIDCPMQDLFRDRYPPFRRPLAGESSGGWYCYFPIPFARSLRIEVRNPGPMYYHVQYHQLPEGTDVRSFTRDLTPEDRAALEEVVRQWSEAGEPPVPLGNAVRRTGETRLAADEKVAILDEKSGGVIRMLRLRVSPATRFTLRSVAVRAYWDGADSPAVEAPLGDFFGTGFGERPYRSLPLAMRADGYVCYFPMPYARSARIEVANEGKKPVQVAWEVAVGPSDLADAAYFHAKWRRVETQKDQHVTLLEATGRGHFVGVNMNMQGDHGLWFLEGDEKIYVDGESEPSIYGTGTEDYFTSGWYFNTGPFDLPFHGALVKEDPNSRISAYRWQVPDCIPFTKSLRVEIEHGGTNDYPGADYACTSYWYQDSPSSAWAPLPEAAARRPASVIARAVVEAESAAPVQSRVVSDEELPVELSRGAGIAPPEAGARLSVDVPVREEGSYTVGLGVLKGPAAGRFTLAIDGAPVGETVDAYSEKPAVERLVIGMIGPLSAGTHRLELVPAGRNERSSGEELLIDFFTLRKQLYPGALEGERLKVLDATPGAPLDPQDMRGFGDGWSGDSHLWFRPVKAPAFFTLELPVRKAGRYRVSVYLTKAVDYGLVQMSLDGKEIGTVFDGFNNGVVPSGKVVLGEVRLDEGSHALKFTVVGKNEKSLSYMVGVDAVLLEPAP